MGMVVLAVAVVMNNVTCTEETSQNIGGWKDLR